MSVCMVALTRKETTSVLAFGGSEATVKRLERVANIQEGQSLPVSI